MLKLFKNFKPFAFTVTLVLLFIFLQAMTELSLPTLMAEIVDNGMMKGDTEYILRYGAIMLIVALFSSFCSIIGAYYSSKVAVGFGTNLRNKIFTRIENYSLHEFDKLGTASLITRTTNDIMQIQNIIIVMLRFMVFAPIMCIGGVIMAISRDKELTLILLVSIPIMLVVMGLIARTVMPLFKAMQKKLDRLSMVLRENLTGIRVIRAFNKLDYERKRFLHANKDLTDTAIKVNRTMAIMHPITMLIMNLTSIAITWFGGLRISRQEMQIGDMMAFIQYAMLIMFSFIMVAVMFVMIPRAQASAERINEVLEMTPEIIDPTEELMIADGIRGCVEFENVTFRYPGAEEPVIRNISFKTEPGKTTAIIGGTGSGKSTLVHLIPRFYDVSDGRILVNGADISMISQEELRKKIGLVPQSVLLFSGTVAENIRYGKQDATDEEVMHAAEVAQAADFIAEMSAGFETEIAQGGTNLSGGQKQRISIARALVRKPEIYIFDDSFSALDFKTDALLRAKLKQETKASAVIIVAQRVSTVLDADCILVLEEGRLVGKGNHKELMNTCEVYREIVASQLSEEEMSKYE